MKTEQAHAPQFATALDFCGVLTKFINGFITHPAVDNKEELDAALREVQNYRDMLEAGQMPDNFEANIRALAKHIFEQEPEEVTTDRLWIKAHALNYCNGLIMVAMHYEKENGKPAPSSVMAAYSQLQGLRSKIEKEDFAPSELSNLKAIGRQMLKEIRESITL